MRSSLDYAGLAQLCGRSPIMRKIMRAHNRVIPPSLVYTVQGRVVVTTDFCDENKAEALDRCVQVVNVVQVTLIRCECCAASQCQVCLTY